MYIKRLFLLIASVLAIQAFTLKSFELPQECNKRCIGAAIAGGVIVYGIDYMLQKKNDSTIEHAIKSARKSLIDGIDFLNNKLPKFQEKAVDIESLYQDLSFVHSSLLPHSLEMHSVLSPISLDISIDYEDRWFRTLYNYFNQAVANNHPRALIIKNLKLDIDLYNQQIENRKDEIQQLQAYFTVHNGFCALYNKYRKSLDIFVKTEKFSKVLTQLVDDYMQDSKLHAIDYQYVHIAHDLKRKIDYLENALIDYNSNKVTSFRKKIAQGIDYFKEMLYKLKHTIEYTQQLIAYNEEQHQKELLKLQQQQLEIQKENQRLQRQLLYQHAFCHCNHIHLYCTSQCCNRC